MKQSNQNLSDEDLLAFADGALDAENSAAIRDRVADDQDAQTRLKLMRLSAEALADSASHDLDEDAVADHAAFIRSFGTVNTESIQKFVPTSSTDTVTGRWWQIAAAIVLFVGGAGAGVVIDRWQTPAEPKIASATPETGKTNASGMASKTSESGSGSSMSKSGMSPGMGGWIASVVEYQNLYTRATVEPSPRPDAKGVAALEERLGTALGAGLSIPDLDDAGLEFRRGQILAFDKRPLVQLAYLPEGQGRPVALCIIAMNGEKRTPAYSKRLDMGVVRWSDGKLDYVLVGWQSEKQLLKAAELARTRLNRI